MAWRWLVAVSLWMGCGVADEVPRADAEVAEEIRAAFDGLVEAATSLDVDAYLAFFDQDRFSGLNANGTVVHGFLEFAQAYEEQVELIERYESLVFSNLKITVLNQHGAVLVNEFAAELVLHSGATVESSGAGTQVWARREGGWRLVNVSSSVAP